MKREGSYRKPSDDPLGVFPVEFRIDASKTALMIIDMQKYEYHPDYPVGRFLRAEFPEIFFYVYPRLRDIVIPNIRGLLDFFREHGLRIIYVGVGPLLPDASDMIPRRRARDLRRLKKTGIEHFLHVGTPEREILDELKPASGELVIYKNSSSPFTSTGIDQILRNMAIETLVITGVSTSACVETTARDAADRGYNCLLVDDACAAKNQELHDGTMRNFELFFGRVVTTRRTIEEFSLQVNRRKSSQTA